MPFYRVCLQGPNATREKLETHLAGAVREFEEGEASRSCGMPCQSTIDRFQSSGDAPHCSKIAAVNPG